MDAVRLDRASRNEAETIRFRSLPDDAPLEMPMQSLRTAPGSPRRLLASAPRGVGWRRAFVLAGTIALLAGAAREMYLTLEVGGLTLLECLILALFIALFAWIAFAFVSALAGFVLRLRGGEGRLQAAVGATVPKPSTRTALLMPVYNEDPERVVAGLQAMWESLLALGVADTFAIFILSDTTDPDIWIAEEAAYLGLLDRTKGAGHIFYRRRPSNIERKSGNIADWVRRFGGAFPQMLILDADSLMSAVTIARLAVAMENNPDVGLIQTLPTIVHGTTLFARLQQFASRIYGPLIGHGIAWWHGAEGNYWGHNAIIRTKAFAEAAGLPRLRGPMPFGGHILSHDFVEAALIRRGGWAVHMIPELPGSYEEGPPSLADVAIRDRRWAQGNLQHAAVLPARGLHWVSRLHLLTGIGSYITAPMWLLFLVTGLLVALQARFVPPEYFGSGPSLFPQWPAQDPVRSTWVFVGTMAILLLPKFLAFLTVLARREERRASGGAMRLFLGVILETVLAGLMAPSSMLSQSAAVISILLGRDAGWQAQRREGGSGARSDRSARYWMHSAFGIALGLAAYLVSPSLLLWMSPVVLGLSLAVPLAVLSRSPSAGKWLGQRTLLRIPEEAAQPLVLARARALRQSLRAGASGGQADAFARLVEDPALFEAHLAMLPPPRRPRIDPINPALVVGLAKLEEAETLAEARNSLSAGERAAVLGDRRGIERIARLAAAAPALGCR